MVNCMEIQVGIASINMFISCTELGYASVCKLSHYVKIYDNQNGTKNHSNFRQT